MWKPTDRYEGEQRNYRSKVEIKKSGRYLKKTTEVKRFNILEPGKCLMSFVFI